MQCVFVKLKYKLFPHKYVTRVESKSGYLMSVRMGSARPAPPALSHMPPASTSPAVPAPLNEQTAAHGVDTATIKNDQAFRAA
jgi:hypothetical protein